MRYHYLFVCALSLLTMIGTSWAEKPFELAPRDYGRAFELIPREIGVSGNKRISSEELLSAEVTLSPKEGRLESDPNGQVYQISELGKKRLGRTAIEAIVRRLSEKYQEVGVLGVRIQVNQTQVQLAGVGGALVFKIVEARVADVIVRTVTPEGETVDEGLTESTIKGGSPLTVGSLLTLSETEEFVHRLNRHPRRRVDSVLRPSAKSDQVDFVYGVTEERPWILYGQLENTGTDRTGEWRQRIGFAHYQFSGRDDTLSLEYSTATLDGVHALSATYDLPLDSDRRWYLKVGTDWSEYEASDLGFSGSKFLGSSSSLFSEVRYTAYQQRDLFLDLTAGVRYMGVMQDQTAFGLTKESTSFFLPSLGVQVTRQRPTTRFSAGIKLESNMASVAGTDTGKALDRLGRFAVTEDFTVLQYNGSVSTYIDALFSDEKESASAHEVALQAYGQMVLEDKRIPATFTQSAGGFTSVRGYDESFTSGDQVLVVSGEYRLHLSRILAAGPSATVFGHELQVRPSEETGQSDLDIILRGFIDYASVIQNDPQSGDDRSKDLLSAGIGFDLNVMRHVILKADYGVILHEAANGVEKGDEGDSRLHIRMTVLY